MSKKKKYEAPTVELIDFTIAGGIAGSCRAWATEENGWIFSGGEDGWLVRRDGAGNSGLRENSGLWDGAFCYHVPADDLTIHTS